VAFNTERIAHIVTRAKPNAELQALGARIRALGTPPSFAAD
jgi:hypothetical protein